MVYKVNAFTDYLEGGNPAGVVLNADHLSEEKMLSIAKEVGYSETAFIMNSNKADYKIRFFTPSDEVDLCGHATIATFTVLNLTKGLYTIETKAGILPITIQANGYILMEQLKPTFYETVPKSDIAKSLGLNENDIVTMPQVTSTGLKDIMIHVKNQKVLKEIQPDYDTIADISREYASTGYHVFTLDSEKTARCRNFAPLYAINEEAATGTASGAVSGYIVQHQLLPLDNGVHHFIFEQGIEMNRPSEIHSYITITEKEITSVIIGGKGIIQ